MPIQKHRHARERRPRVPQRPRHVAHLLPPRRLPVRAVLAPLPRRVLPREPEPALVEREDRDAARGDKRVEVRVAPDVLREAVHGDDDGAGRGAGGRQVGARVELRRGGPGEPGFGVCCACHVSVRE